MVLKCPDLLIFPLCCWHECSRDILYHINQTYQLCFGMFYGYRCVSDAVRLEVD